jgi:hypothetical protein
MEMPPVLSAVIGWLRAGYPEGVPDVDYVPLFALLGSQLTDKDVESVAEVLASETDHESAEAIRTAEGVRHRPGTGPARGGRLAPGQAGPAFLARRCRRLTAPFPARWHDAPHTGKMRCGGQRERTGI